MEEKSEQRILVVDDEQAITDFVSFNLSKEGYQVDVAHNGNEAVDMANANDYDLVILDVMLPGIDGYEVCRRIRAKSNVPVLFLSARDTELDKVVGLELGGDDYLPSRLASASYSPACTRSCAAHRKRKTRGQMACACLT